MAALKYWDGTKWVQLSSALQDTLEWIDLGLASNWTAPVAPTVVVIPFTVVRAGSGLTGDANGRINVAKAGVYHVSSSVTTTVTTGYLVHTLRHIRAGGVIRQQEQVAYGSSAWDSDTVTGIFDAQVGDQFDIVASAQVAGTVVEATRAQFNAFRLSGPGTVAALNAATVMTFMTGPWSGTVPTATQGSPFTTPAGVLRATVTCTGYTPNGSSTPIRVECYIDGVQIGTMRMEVSTVQNNHIALSSLPIAVNVTAGTHYVYFKQSTGSSDASDFGQMFGIVTSASGQLTDAATVLSALQTSNQALAGSGWTTVAGWTVQHAYPQWAPESAGTFVVPADGYYRVDFSLMTQSGGTVRVAAVWVNGVQVSQQQVIHGADANWKGVPTWWEGNLRAGDQVQARSWSDGTALTTQSTVTRLVIRKIYSGGIPAGQGAPDIPWTALALQNGWVNYGAPFMTAAYRRIGGIVYLRGLIANGSLSTITTLPVGCRPSATHLFGTMSTTNAGRVDIGADGSVVATAPSGSAWLTLSGVTFPADQ